MADPLTIIHGDALTSLRTLESQSVQTCVTSPPYWGLRDYGTATWSGGDADCDHVTGRAARTITDASKKQSTNSGSWATETKDICGKCGAHRVDIQIGLETTPDEYVARLVEIFRDVKRVLRDDGTLWLNLGDSYATGTTAGRQDGTLNLGNGTNEARKISRVGTPTGLKTKDLVGIPWMVAFALRAPYYTGRIKDERLRYWLAGLVDGEGCLTILETTSPHGSGNSFPPVLQVRMCDLAPVSRCAEITGLGCDSPEQNPPSQGGQRGSYQWRLSARNAADIAAELYPYLMVKKRQALVVWNHQKVRDSYETKKGVRVPVDALEKQKRLREIIQALNANQPVDLPSWLEEPPSLHEQGWYLRSDVIWSKPNPMPESVTDRPTKSHEYIFLLAKNQKYFFDAEAVKEPARDWGTRDRSNFRSGTTDPLLKHHGFTNGNQADTGRNIRSVWNIATRSFSGAHFATFPPELIKPCILAGAPIGGVVLDPFAGSGTTGKVAIELGRRAILIEPKAEYVEMIKRRCQTTIGLPLAI